MATATQRAEEADPSGVGEVSLGQKMMSAVSGSLLTSLLGTSHPYNVSYTSLDCTCRYSQLHTNTIKSPLSTLSACDYNHKKPYPPPHHGHAASMAEHSHSFATCHRTSAYRPAAGRFSG
jgi:hypothetical protein